MFGKEDPEQRLHLQDRRLGWPGRPLTKLFRPSAVIAFRADNPGVWMDHCHNLPHATQGLVAHLMYEHVDTRYLLNHRNKPE
ncbi:multicopper oxidase domain-containing protein [Spelaeicoccus albus]|uniref:multicopper oxidase domain-containing protein n=1 Tax=Spelaeicoccus albus TaxID=1280376 RepID=UPI003144EBA0